MSDAYIADTELAATKAVYISNLVQRELAAAAILRGTITDVSAYAQAGLKTISFPKLTSFTVGNRTEGVLGETQAITSAVDDLSLSFNSYVSWGIDAFTAKQSRIDAQVESIKRASAAMGRYVDSQIIVKLAAICSDFRNTGSDVDATYANLLAMRKYLLQKDAMLNMCSIIASPAQEAVLLSLDEFKRFDYAGQSSIHNGIVGQILGMPVYVSNLLADKQLFMYEKSACVIGFQKEAEYGEQSFIELGVGAKRAAVDMYFGLAGQQLAVHGAASGKSPLVAGLND